MTAETTETAIPEGYVFACKREDLPERGKHTVTVAGKRVLIVVCGENLFAVEDRCPQTGLPIAHGKVLDCVLTTPTTGASYDLRTGKYVGGGLSPLQSHGLPVWLLLEIGDTVYVRPPAA